MNTRTFALLAALLALTLGVAACGTGGNTTETDTGSSPGSTSGSTPTTEGAPGEGEGAGKEAGIPTIVVENGEPVGGVTTLEYSAGEQIRFKVKGDEAEEIHVHGYNLMEEIPQGGGTVEFDFPAEIEGIFEAELEGKGVQILELRVNP